ncbi:MAG TPA: ECF-type sigma factor [Candidatus Krumholzibacteria bacterium]|nr:ECF-type sigma factor [Candidatus Krumholzibacteria bacterium]
MDDNRTRVTHILQNLDPSDPRQIGELVAVVYDELREIAQRALRHERPGHTLQPTALVNEVYLRLFDEPANAWENRAHFFGVVARAMRQVLVDHARKRHAAKRGGDLERVTLVTDIAEAGDNATDVLELHLALEKLSQNDEALARLVELRFFAGLTLDEAADAIGVSRRKAAKDWAVARLWLQRELGRG